MLVPAAVAIALFGADAIHGLDRGFLSGDPTDRALRVAQAVALALIAGGIAVERLRLRRTRARVARLVLDIGAAPAARRAARAPRRSLGDPALALLHPADGGWMDEAGRACRAPGDGDRAVTLVRAGGRTCSPSCTGAGCSTTRSSSTELATTARLAIEHERLQRRPSCAPRRAPRRRASGSSRPPTASAARSSATCTTARSSASSRSGSSIRLARRRGRDRTQALAEAEE